MIKTKTLYSVIWHLGEIDYWQKSQVKTVRINSFVILFNQVKKDSPAWKI